MAEQQKVTQKEHQLNLINKHQQTTVFINNSRISRGMLRHIQNIDCMDDLIKNELGYSIDVDDVSKWLENIKELNEKIQELENLGAKLLINSNNATIQRNRAIRNLIAKNQNHNSELSNKSAKEEIKKA